MPKDLTERIPFDYHKAQKSSDPAAKICVEQFDAITAQMEAGGYFHNPSTLTYRFEWFRAGFIAGRAQLESIVAEKIVFSSIR